MGWQREGHRDRACSVIGCHVVGSHRTGSASFRLAASRRVIAWREFLAELPGTATIGVLVGGSSGDRFDLRNGSLCRDLSAGPRRNCFTDVHAVDILNILRTGVACPENHRGKRRTHVRSCERSTSQKAASLASVPMASHEGGVRAAWPWCESQAKCAPRTQSRSSSTGSVSSTSLRNCVPSALAIHSLFPARAIRSSSPSPSRSATVR